MSNGGNPSGIVYTREDLERIADLARRLDLWVFSDEEYEKTLLDGTTHYSIASLPGMKERTVTAFSFSKAYGMTAYRIGYAVGPAKVIDHMHSILRFSLQACSAVGQRAAHAVLTGDMEPWLRDNIANLERKRDYLVDRLNRIPGSAAATRRRAATSRSRTCAGSGCRRSSWRSTSCGAAASPSPRDSSSARRARGTSA